MDENIRDTMLIGTTPQLLIKMFRKLIKADTPRSMDKTTIVFFADVKFGILKCHVMHLNRLI